MSREIISALLQVPYIENGRDLNGADCAGIVELYYKMKFGVDLKTRGEIKHSQEAIQTAVSNTGEFKIVSNPLDDCVVLMRRFGLDHGHVGIYFEGSVLHSANRIGPMFLPMKHASLRGRITGFMSYAFKVEE